MLSSEVMLVETWVCRGTITQREGALCGNFDSTYFRYVAQLVEALHYKPEGREFDPRRCH